MKGFSSSVLDVAVLFLALSYALSVVFVFFTQPLANDVTGADFACYYFRGVALGRGVDIYDLDAVRNMALSLGYNANFPEYVYPPLLAILLVPLTAVSLHSAFIIWLLLNHILLFATFLLYFKAVGGKSFGEFKPNLLILLLFIASLFYSVNVGQVTVLMLFLFVAAYYALKKNMPALAGASLGFSAMIKPVALVFYPYLLVRRQYKALSFAVLADVLLLAFSILYAGWEVIDRFLKDVLLPLLFSATSWESLLVSLDWRVLAVVNLILLIIFYSIFLLRGKTGDFDLDYAILLTTILLVTPHMVYYNYVYLIPVFWILYDKKETLLKGKKARILSALLLLLVVSPTTHISLYAIVALWLLQLYLMRSS